MKKRILYSIMVLALAVGLGLPLAISSPVMASEIAGSKVTDPALPNVYYLGDTINYVMTISNPAGNPATNNLTRIWDTLPNGTVIEFLDPGETLVQAPGDTETFYASYTVDEADLEWNAVLGYWVVTNEFDAVGMDSAGDPVSVGIARNSRIIRPDTDITIGASETTVPSDQSVDLTITEENTGWEELTDPYVEVYKNGEAFATLTAPPDSGDLNDDGVLDPGETWTWTIDSGPITNATTFVALGFGTDPLGNEVSYDEGYLDERDEVTVNTIDPHIDLEKYVWDGADWHDADDPTGPYLPGSVNPVIFRFVMENTGDVDLTDVDLSDTDMLVFYEDFDCIIAATFPTTLDKDEIKTFYGKLAWEPGQHSNTGTVEGFYGTLKVEDEDPAHYFGADPDIDIEKYVWDGTGWQDADHPEGPHLLDPDPDPVVFQFVIENTGNVDLTDVTLSDTDMVDFYEDFGCTISATFPTTLDKDETKTFYGKLAWEPGQHSNTGTVEGFYGTLKVEDEDPAHYFGSHPRIDLEKAVWDGSTWHDADAPTGPYLPDSMNPVVFRFIITNDGGGLLTSVNLTDTHMADFYEDSACTIPFAFPIPTLAEDDSVTVFGKLDWQPGQHSNTATAVGTPPVGANVTASDPAHYFGSEPPPVVVGWQGEPVSRLAVLSPLLGLLASVLAGAGMLMLRQRRRTV